MKRKPQILFLTRNCPFGQSYGGQLRTLHTARHLQQFGDLRMSLLLLEAVDSEVLKRTRAEFELEDVMLMESTPIRGIRERLGHEFNPNYLNTEGWRLSPPNAARIARAIREYDIIWIHNLAVANGACLRFWPKTILDVDDLRTQFHRSALACAGTWLERAHALRQTWLWSRREAQLLKRFSILAVCSEADRQHLGAHERVHVVPNGFEAPSTMPSRKPVVPPRVGFIGLLRYPPNLEGVLWFIRHVWPKIKRQHPTARLRLIGAGAGPEIVAAGPDIDVLGWVDDPSAEVATWSSMIVPIRMGGGTRIKVAEGFGRRCPVISTTLGAFGYDLTSGEELLLADHPEDFAHACNSILSDPALGDRIVERAWEKYSRHWTWKAMAPRVHSAAEHCLREGGWSYREPARRTDIEVQSV